MGRKQMTGLKWALGCSQVAKVLPKDIRERRSAAIFSNAKYDRMLNADTEASS